jgi:hypothetical protein
MSLNTITPWKVLGGLLVVSALALGLGKPTSSAAEPTDGAPLSAGSIATAICKQDPAKCSTSVPVLEPYKWYGDPADGTAGSVQAYVIMCHNWPQALSVKVVDFANAMDRARPGVDQAAGQLFRYIKALAASSGHSEKDVWAAWCTLVTPTMQDLTNRLTPGYFAEPTALPMPAPKTAMKPGSQTCTRQRPDGSWESC